MEFHIVQNGHEHMVLAIGNADTGCDIQHDLVRTELDSNLLIRSCTVFVNLGLPVLHASRVDVQHGMQETGQDTCRAPELLGKLVGCAVLSAATGRPLVQHTPNHAGSAGELEEFNRLFPEFAADLSDMGSATVNQPGGTIMLQDDLIDFGLENRLLKSSNDVLLPIEGNLDAKICESRCPITAYEEIRPLLEIRNPASRMPNLKPELDAAREALKSVPRPSPATVWHYGNTGHRCHRYRMQAATAYPILAEMMVEDQAVSEAIDNCQPLRPEITRLTGLSAARLKRISRIDLSRWIRGDLSVAENDGQDFQFNSGQQSELRQLLAICKHLDPAWIPDNADEWMAFRNLHAAFILPATLRYELDQVDLMQSMRGRWMAHVERLARCVDTKPDNFDSRAMQLVAEDSKAMIDDFAYSVLLPAILRPVVNTRMQLPYPTSEILRASGITGYSILSGPGRDRIGNLVGTAQRWQNRLQSLYTIEQQCQQVRKTIDEKMIRTCKTWPALTGSLETSAGYTIRCLNTVASLREESRRLEHCVGKLYLTSARQGQVHLYSVQDPSGSISHSTFEVTRPRSGTIREALKEISLVQHKAKANGKPARKLKLAVDEWFAALHTDRLELNLQEVLDWRSKARRVRQDSTTDHRSLVSPRSAWNNVLASSWSDNAVHERIWHEWRTYILPGKLGKLASDTELLQLKPVLELRDQLGL